MIWGFSHYFRKHPHIGQKNVQSKLINGARLNKVEVQNSTGGWWNFQCQVGKSRKIRSWDDWDDQDLAGPGKIQTQGVHQDEFFLCFMKISTLPGKKLPKRKHQTKRT